MRTLILGSLFIAGCGSKLPSEAPSWQRKVVGGDCEVALAVSVPEPSTTSAKLVGEGVSALEVLARTKIPSGKRVEACVRTRAGTGEIADWLVVVRGIVPDEMKALDAAGERLPTGAHRIGRGPNKIFHWRSTWALASDRASSRLDDLSESDVSAPIPLEDGVIGALRVRGEAAKRIAREHGGSIGGVGPLTHGLEEAAGELRVHRDRLSFHVHLCYEREDATRALAGLIEEHWRLAGDAAADGHDGALVKLRRSANLNVTRKGSTLDIVLDAFEGKGMATLPRPATKVPESAPVYGGACPAWQRFDLDRKGCVTQP